MKVFDDNDDERFILKQASWVYVGKMVMNDILRMALKEVASVVLPMFNFKTKILAINPKKAVGF